MTESIPSTSEVRTAAERRRSPRMKFNIPVEMSWTKNKTPRTEQVHTLSISWFRCTVYSREFFQPGIFVQLRRSDGKAISGIVIYCLEDHGSRMAEIGVGFEEDGRAFWEMPAWKDG